MTNSVDVQTPSTLEILLAIRDMRCLDHMERLVLDALVLRSHGGSVRETNSTIEQLQLDANVCERSVQRGIRALTRAGLIAVKPNRKSSSTYLIRTNVIGNLAEAARAAQDQPTEAVAKSGGPDDPETTADLLQWLQMRWPDHQKLWEDTFRSALDSALELCICWAGSAKRCGLTLELAFAGDAALEMRMQSYSDLGSVLRRDFRGLYDQFKKQITLVEKQLEQARRSSKSERD